MWTVPCGARTAATRGSSEAGSPLASNARDASISASFSARREAGTNWANFRYLAATSAALVAIAGVFHTLLAPDAAKGAYQNSTRRSGVVCRVYVDRRAGGRSTSSLVFRPGRTEHTRAPRPKRDGAR